MSGTGSTPPRRTVGRLNTVLRHPPTGVPIRRWEKKGSSCFTSIIKCGEFGNNFQHQTRRYRDGEVGVWTYATKRGHVDACSMPSVREDVLKELCCQALELETFDPVIFSEKVDHITITGITLDHSSFSQGYRLSRSDSYVSSVSSIMRLTLLRPDFSLRTSP